MLSLFLSLSVRVFLAVLIKHGLLESDLVGEKWHIQTPKDLQCVFQCLCYNSLKHSLLTAVKTASVHT